MAAANGAGLAAPQIGENLRIVISAAASTTRATLAAAGAAHRADQP